jgi:hypothetical protein
MKRDDATRRVTTERRSPALDPLPAALKERVGRDAAAATTTLRNSSPRADGSPLCGIELRRDGVRLTLPLGRSIVGRAPSANVVLDSVDVSRQHACVIVEATRARVRDLSSANGTTLNGKPVREALLKGGDRLAFAGITFDVQLVRLGGTDDR